ncbi:MAG: ABC transporter permease [Methylocella sp.]
MLQPLRVAFRRLLSAGPSSAGVIVITFLISHALPGDPAVLFAGPAANADSVAQVRAHLGLDRSLPVQFLAYVQDLAHGDLGQSLTTGQPVLTDLLQRLPASLQSPCCARAATRSQTTG